MSRRLRRILTVLALCAAAALTPAVTEHLSPTGRDTAWGAGQTPDDTAWGNPPTERPAPNPHGSGTGNGEPPVETPNGDTAWG